MVSAELKEFGKIALSSLLNYLVLLAIFSTYWIIDAVVPGFHQRFSLNNISLQYPYAEHERVTLRQNVVIAFLGPAVIIFLYTIIIDGFRLNGTGSRQMPRHSLFTPRDQRSKRQMRTQLWELNCAWLGLGLSQALAFIVMAILKRMGGKPRPDLIDRCQPAPGSMDRPMYGLSDISICTQTNPKILGDGFMSFPSGHSSCSFAGLAFLSIYLHHKLHPSNRYFPHQNWRTFICVLPLLVAAMIVLTRIMDARHHPFDVISGSLLGIATSVVGWRQYFPIPKGKMGEEYEEDADGNGIGNGGVYLPVSEDE